MVVHGVVQLPVPSRVHTDSPHNGHNKTIFSVTPFKVI